MNYHLTQNTRKNFKAQKQWHDHGYGQGFKPKRSRRFY